MKKPAFCLAFIVLCFVGIQAQPQMVNKKPDKQPSPAVLANVSFKVKYEGGMFGYTKKEDGTIKFDDANFRLVFFDKNNKERFAVPYKALIVIYPNYQTSQSTSGKVVQHAPLPGAGIAGIFMKDKKRYMIINFDDPDVNAKGVVNFKLESQELLDSAIQTLGTKAEMQPRGDSFYRPKTNTPGN